MERHIVGLGGGGDTDEQTALLHDYILGLVGTHSSLGRPLPTSPRM